MPSWNRGHIVGQKPPLKPREVWSIRTRLQVAGAERDLALFNLAIDSKLRALRPGDNHRRPHCAFRRCPRPRGDRSKEDGAAGTVRDHRADPSRRRCMDKLPPPRRKGFPIPESGSGKAAHINKAVWADRRQMGGQHRPRPETVRHALDEADQGVADLQEDRQYPSRATASWSYKAGEHRALPGH